MHWVEMIKKTARFNEVSDVSGILNGTCNYMLDHMERSGLSFEEALARAQALGYAEADPTADITGADVRNKAIISASLAYRTPVVRCSAKGAAIATPSASCRCFFPRTKSPHTFTTT